MSPINYVIRQRILAFARTLDEYKSGNVVGGRIGANSKLYWCPNKASYKMAELPKKTAATWEVVDKKRTGRSKKAPVKISVGIGMIEEGDDVFNPEPNGTYRTTMHLAQLFSQNDDDLNSPARREKRTNKQSRTASQTWNTDVRDFVNKIIDTPMSPLYNAVTEQARQMLQGTLAADPVYIRPVPAWEKWTLEDDDDETWPVADDFPFMTDPNFVEKNNGKEAIKDVHDRISAKLPDGPGGGNNTSPDLIALQQMAEANSSAQRDAAALLAKAIGGKPSTTESFEGMT